MSLDGIIAFLSVHQGLTLVVLFFGSYFETLIGISFLVPGEFFFLAGAILAGMGQVHILLVTLVLYVGGIMGDHSSYWIGRFWGDQFYFFMHRKPFFKRFFTLKNYDRGTEFFQKYSGWSVFMGRFLGPVSWVMPFLSGAFKLPFRQFVLFDTPGVILGIGQFIVIGYLFGKSYKAILVVVQEYLLTGVFVVVCVLGIVFYFRKLLHRLNLTFRHSLLRYFSELRAGNSMVLRHSLKVACIALVGIGVLYVVVLMTIFFVENERLSGAVPPDLHYTFASLDDIRNAITSTTYYKNGTENVGPINVVLISREPLQSILSDAHWVLVDTFTRNSISMKMFAQQARNGTLPISDLYFNGVPQNYAYEYASSTLITREHIRIWNLGTLEGTPVYALSVSKDIGIDVYRDLSFVVPYHSIDLDVDASRSFFVESLRSAFPTLTDTQYPSKLGPVAGNRDNELLYFTDGEIEFVEL